MSEAVSALGGRAAAGVVTIRDAGLQGMVTLRGDLTDPKLKAVVKKVTGVPMPETRRAVVMQGQGAAWMSPDEVLLLVPYAQAGAVVATIETALAGSHFMAVNVSDARAFLTVSGSYAADVMAKNAPVDFDTFGPGDFRRSRLGQVAAAFWMDDAQTYHVICFRSVADYVFDLLRISAEAGPVRHT